MPVLITLTSWLMLLVLMLLLHSLTTVDLLRPILSLAAFWMIWLTSLSVSISSLWLLQRILYWLTRSRLMSYSCWDHLQHNIAADYLYNNCWPHLRTPDMSPMMRLSSDLTTRLRISPLWSAMSALRRARTACTNIFQNIKYFY